MITPALEAGLRLQHAELARRLAAGMPRAGWKICVNDARMQKKLGIDASFAGFLDGSRLLRSGEAWRVAEGSVLGIEPEIALRFRRTLSPEMDDVELRDGIEGAAPAIEVVDWKDARFELESLAASSSFHAGVAIGELRPFELVPEIAERCPLLLRGHEKLGVPDPALVPRDLVWLVRTVTGLLARFDARIEAGDWLICGACTNPARVERGDEVSADFGELGKVSLRFE